MLEFSTSLKEKKDYFSQEVQKLTLSHLFEELKPYKMAQWNSFFEEVNLEKFLHKAQQIQKDDVDYIVSIGVGGSFQGCELLVEFLDQGDKWIFLGPSLDIEENTRIKKKLAGKKVGFNIISKTGATFEVSYFMDLFLTELKQAVFVNVVSSSENFYQKLKNDFNAQPVYFFTIDENTGGRFSLFSEMGLLCLFLCGGSVEKVTEALRAEKRLCEEDFFNYTGVQRGISRTIAQKDYRISLEFLSTIDRKLTFAQRWARQLFCESDGKDEKGLYISLGYYPADAHSIGQILKEGKKNVCETFYLFKNLTSPPHLNLENPQYFDTNVNKIAEIKDIFSQSMIEERLESGLITSVYFLENSVEDLFRLLFSEMIAVSFECYLLGINPFDQPGVEGYKKKIKSKLS